jgi:hypothetical protein
MTFPARPSNRTATPPTAATAARASQKRKPRGRSRQKAMEPETTNPPPAKSNNGQMAPQSFDILTPVVGLGG